MIITWEEAEARAWLEEFYPEEAAELQESKDRSRNADYDFY